MGLSLAKGLLSGHADRVVYFFDPATVISPSDSSSLGSQLQQLSSNKEVALKQPDLLILATKPQYIAEVCRELHSSLDVKRTLVMSLAAGVPTQTMEASLPSNTRLVRCMPNIPCTVQRMAAGACAGKNSTKDDLDFVVRLFSGMGTCLPVGNEDLMHAVTGVSGSGPAYIFMLIEALADGGVKNGLPRATALELAMHTVRGAAEMCIQTKLHPGVLKDQVCSPGGTTMAAVATLEDKGLRTAMIEAVTSATNRSRELAKL